MLKIEVIKFEAMDVITASVATVDCLCGNGCDTTEYGHQIGWSEDTGDIYCPATNHTKCPRYE